MTGFVVVDDFDGAGHRCEEFESETVKNYIKCYYIK